MWSKKIAGIKIGEIVTLVGCYLFLSFLYHFTLWTSYYEKEERWEKLFSLWQWLDNGGLQYIMMFIATAIGWFLIFRVAKEWKLMYRLLLHLMVLPFFLFLAWKGHYWICEQIGLGHLQGNAEKWDIYIPALVYFVQFAIFHAYEYYVITQQKAQYEIELKNSALKSELKAIKAQLNPHFLYNVFNTINASVPKEMEETREMIAQLSDMFRYQLRASSEDLVSLKEELDFTKKYLVLEQNRFEDRLQIHYDVDPTLLSRMVPPMILQPLVENSIKHGISPLREGGEIHISIQKNKEDRLVFEIKDTGVGITDQTEVMSSGIGLSNTHKRLKKMYNSGLFLKNNNPKGLVVQFSM